MRRSVLLLLLALALVAAACGSDSDTDAATATTAATADTTAATTEAAAATTEAAAATTEASATTEAAAATTEAAASAETSSFTIEIWVDNWMAVYVDGELVGEDSVSITTERSFNSEVFSFEAAYPFTLAVEAKDYKETDSGLEYIGENNQQMGDGGLIAQVTDDSTGEIVAVSSGDWSSLVIHQAPLNTDCESSSDPDAECEFTATDAPDGWTATDFDDSAWGTATEWTAADVDPKIGYDEISWDSSAQLIWGSDLEVDNTVLLRTTVG